MINDTNKTRLTLTFALSPKGMANATEIDPKLKERTRRQLLLMRGISIANHLLNKKF